MRDAQIKKYGGAVFRSCRMACVASVHGDASHGVFIRPGRAKSVRNVSFAGGRRGFVPKARLVSAADTPLTSVEFAEALRAFC
jgi:hypothetical protein